MKKIVALLLTISMIFSFTACAKISAEGRESSAMLTGMGGKTVKLTIKGEKLEGTTKIISIPTDEGGGTFAKSEISKDVGKKLVVKFSGLEAGAGRVDIQCKKGDEIVCNVAFMLVVSEQLSLDCGALYIADSEYLEVETEGDNKEEAEANVQIPAMDEDSNLIFLRNLDGEWIEESFDANIVKPKIIAIDEDFVKYQIDPVSAGESDVQFINIPIMKQVVAHYIVTEKQVENQDEKVYVTTISNYTYKDYTMEEYLERKGQGMEIRKIQLFDVGFNIPNGWVIKGFSLFDNKTMKNFEFDENKLIEEIKLPDNIDSVSIDLEYGESSLEYLATSAKTVAEICREIDSLKATESVEDLSVGALSIKYYQTTFGFGQAVWEENGLAKQITFTSEKQTAADNKQLLEAFLSN